MKVISLSTLIVGSASALQCDHANCADWSCTSTNGDNSWCKCFSEAVDASQLDPVTGEPAFYKNAGCAEDSDPCACGETCAPNVANDQCGSNQNAVMACSEETFCHACDNWEPCSTHSNPNANNCDMVRHSNGGCYQCGYRFREPCLDPVTLEKDPSTCTNGGPCTTHTCFVMDETTAPPNKQPPNVIPAQSWVGLCQVCGSDGSAICPLTVSKFGTACTPNLGITERSNGNCGVCGENLHKPCTSSSGPSSVADPTVNSGCKTGHGVATSGMFAGFCRPI
jgi:hypothetical protein